MVERTRFETFETIGRQIIVIIILLLEDYEISKRSTKIPNHAPKKKHIKTTKINIVLKKILYFFYKFD
jgi:hypothetical protein